MAWTRAHERKRDAIIEALHREAKPFEDTSDEAQARRRALPFLEWCGTYMPHYFVESFAPFHQRMADIVGEPDLPTFIAAFRGAGKSVLLSLARPLHRTLSDHCPYWLYGSLVQILAAQNMDFLKIELAENARIRSDYGELDVEGSETEWTVRFAHGSGRRFRSTKFEAFGIGQSPRGRRYGPHRPFEFVGDDLENAELARNPRREKQLWEWLMGAVVPALEPEIHVFTVLGTMFGPDCMLEHARKEAERLDPKGRPLARFFRQPATEDGHSVWPERFSDDFLARKRMQVGLRLWLREYELAADDPDKPFQPAWFEDRFDLKDLPRDLQKVCFLDPAVTQAPTGCPRALVCVGVDKEGMRYVLDAWIARGTPEQMIGKLFEFHSRYHPRVMGIEANGGYQLIKPLLAVWEANKRYRLPARYIDHSKAKDERIQPLAPEMESGRWRWPRHPSAGVRALEAQFLSYPDGWVDGPDAAAGCCEFLSSAWGGGRKPGDPIYKTVESRRQWAGVL